MLKKAITCLRIGSIFTFLVGIYLVYLALTDKKIELFGIIALIVTCIAMVIWYELTVIGLKNKKIWAWKSSIVIFGLYIPSLFIIMGLIGMQSILSDSVREEFFGRTVDEVSNNSMGMSFAEINSKVSGIHKKDESINEYIEKNAALQRYLNYKKDNGDEKKNI